LNELYAEFGYYEEIQVSKYFEGQEGQSIMSGLISTLRENPPKEIAGIDVVRMKDFLEKTTTEFPSGEKRDDIDLPSSNVLQFILEDETVVSVRPSGTEPKIKFYASVTRRNDDLDAAKRETADRLSKIRGFIDETIASV
jgi:phosphoglucomutase